MKFTKVWIVLAILGGVTLLQAQEATEIVDIQKLKKQQQIVVQSEPKPRVVPTPLPHKEKAKKEKKVRHAKKSVKKTHQSPKAKLHKALATRYVHPKHHPKRYTHKHKRYHVKRPLEIRAFRAPLKKWRSIYRKHRAPFYDRFGYFYGYFDTQGFMFEGIFRPYTRHYTYNDRIQGRSLFERRYYKPLRYRAQR